MSKGLQLKSAEVRRTLRDLARSAKTASQAGLGVLVEQTRAEIVAGVSGQRGLPRRVDTGRYLESWQSPARRKDAPTHTQAELSNDTPYATEIEFGTRTLRPGLHMTRAVAVIGQRATGLLKTTIQPLLRGE